jgi:hypothetical protein
LRRYALMLLSAEFDHALLSPRRTMSALDLNRLDFDSPEGLLARLEAVPNPCALRGIRHRLAVILAIATLCGATSLVAMGEVAEELPEEALRRPSCRSSPSKNACRPGGVDDPPDIESGRRERCRPGRQRLDRRSGQSRAPRH